MEQTLWPAAHSQLHCLLQRIRLLSRRTEQRSLWRDGAAEALASAHLQVALPSAGLLRDEEARRGVSVEPRELGWRWRQWRPFLLLERQKR